MSWQYPAKCAWGIFCNIFWGILPFFNFSPIMQLQFCSSCNELHLLCHGVGGKKYGNLSGPQKNRRDYYNFLQPTCILMKKYPKILWVNLNNFHWLGGHLLLHFKCCPNLVTISHEFFLLDNFLRILLITLVPHSQFSRYFDNSKTSSAILLCSPYLLSSWLRK